MAYVPSKLNRRRAAKQRARKAATKHAATFAALTLKERLDDGGIEFYRHNGLPIVHILRSCDGRYVLKGLTGEHSLDAASTDNARLEAHWAGFISNNVATQAR